MTNNRIQKWLADYARHAANRALIEERPGPLVAEAAEIIRALAGPDGALGIADTAAAEVICAECPYHHEEGSEHRNYWEVSPIQSAIELDPEDVAIACDVGRAVRYLASRGLLESHPSNARLVRILMEL